MSSSDASSMDQRLKDALGTSAKIARKKTTTTRSKSAADEEQAKGPSGGTRGTTKGRGSALPTSKKRAASSAPKEAPKAPKKAQKEDAAARAAAAKKRKEVKKEDAKKLNSRTPRAAGFDEDEDLLLCKAFVNCSENPIHGTDQKGTVFFAAVGSRFRDLYNQLDERVLDRTRDDAACKNRWYRYIQPNVNLFNKYYKDLKESKPSGWKEEDLINAAAEEFKDRHAKVFKWKHCVEILHQMPKFNPMINDVEEEGADGVLADDTEEEAGVNKIGTAMGGNLSRPQGAKAAKKKLKDDRTKASVESTKSQSIDRIADSTFALAQSIDKKRASDGLYKMANFFLKTGDVARAHQLMLQYQGSLNDTKEPPKVIDLLDGTAISAATTSASAASVPTPGVPKAAALPKPTGDDHSSDDALGLVGETVGGLSSLNNLTTERLVEYNKKKDEEDEEGSTDEDSALKASQSAGV